MNAPSLMPENAPESAAKTRRPWPMSWVAIAIAIYIPIYTVVTLAYRKPGPAHEPWAEALARRENVRQEIGPDWTRIRASLRASEPNRHAADAVSATREPAPERLDRAIPMELVLIIPAKPALADGPVSVSSGATFVRADSIAFRLAFARDSSAHRFGEVLTYAGKGHLHLFFQDENRPFPDELPVAVAPEMEIALPAETLAAGAWQVSLYCRDAVFNWSIRVE